MYQIQSVNESTVSNDWNSDFWKNIPSACISHFHSESSDHRPTTEVKLCYEKDRIHLFFHVYDQYVRAVYTEPNSPVCKDSCVEFFVRPKEGKGYFNFELNCGGTLLLFYITDSTRTENDLKERVSVDLKYIDSMNIQTSQPKVVDPEIQEPTEWTAQYSIPREMLEAYVGPLNDFKGQKWEGNFFKCGDETSHPHWASWAPIGTELNFHMPQYFTDLEFI